MMNNVNLSLAFLTVVFRKFYEKLKTSRKSSLISKRPFWQKHLLYMTPCMYLSMFCVGLYYTYKQIDQKNVLSLKRNNRILQIKDHMKRRRFIERNRIWFLKNLASGDKGREEVLKVLGKIPRGNSFIVKSKYKIPNEKPSSNNFNDFNTNSNVRVKESYSDSTLSIESRVKLPKQSYSSTNCLPSAIEDKEINTFYGNLPIYENFENNPDIMNNNMSNAHGDSSENIENFNMKEDIDIATLDQEVQTTRKSHRRTSKRLIPKTKRKKKVIKNTPAPRKRRSNKTYKTKADTNTLIRRTRSGKVYNRNMAEAQLNSAKL